MLPRKVRGGTIAKPPYGALPANCPVPLSKWGNQAPAGRNVVSTLSDTKATEKLRKKIPVFAGASVLTRVTELSGFVRAVRST